MEAIVKNVPKEKRAINNNYLMASMTDDMVSLAGETIDVVPMDNVYKRTEYEEKFFPQKYKGWFVSLINGSIFSWHKSWIKFKPDKIGLEK